MWRHDAPFTRDVALDVDIGRKLHSGYYKDFLGIMDEPTVVFSVQVYIESKHFFVRKKFQGIYTKLLRRTKKQIAAGNIRKFMVS